MFLSVPNLAKLNPCQGLSLQCGIPVTARLTRLFMWCSIEKPSQYFEIAKRNDYWTTKDAESQNTITSANSF